ncbi:MAG: hypothetical protein ABFD49_05925 [Armatimonadota bacterium]|nr:hypothetical protein [bacterium]
MKKLFPEMPDVPQSMANRAVRIVEKHLRQHRVEKAKDLSEEAKIRLYRDLRFLFEGGEQPRSGSDGGRFSIRMFVSHVWEKLEDFLSACEANRDGWVNVMVIVSCGELSTSARTPWRCGSANCGGSG